MWMEIQSFIGTLQGVPIKNTAVGTLQGLSSNVKKDPAYTGRLMEN